MRCFFEDWDAGPCDGRLIAAHLLPKQLLKRTFPHGVVLEGDQWRKVDRGEDRYQLPYRSLRDLCADPRSWVPCCGGPMGNSAHHGQLDVARTLRIDWTSLPFDLIVFADELGLGWWLEREYGNGASPAGQRGARG